MSGGSQTTSYAASGSPDDVGSWSNRVPGTTDWVHEFKHRHAFYGEAAFRVRGHADAAVAEELLERLPHALGRL